METPDSIVLDTAASDAASTTTITLKIKDRDTGLMVDGMKACIVEHSSIACETTNSLGSFTIINVPNDEDVTIALSKAGYVKYAIPHGKGGAGFNMSLTIDSLSTENKAVTDAGLTLDPKAGRVGVSIISSPSGNDGVMLKLASAVGDGPFYKDTTGKIDKTLTVTSTQGNGLIFNVPPGEHELTASKTGKTCSIARGIGWKGTSSTARVKVIADMKLMVAISCL